MHLPRYASLAFTAVREPDAAAFSNDSPSITSTHSTLLAQPSAAIATALSSPTPSSRPIPEPTGALIHHPAPFPARPLSPTTTADTAANDLELREIVDGVAPVLTVVASQYPTISTAWMETLLPGSIKTWVPVVYTQTFPEIPDQGHKPGSGSVGLGTIQSTEILGRVRTTTPKYNAGEYGAQRRTEMGGLAGLVVALLGYLV